MYMKKIAMDIESAEKHVAELYEKYYLKGLDENDYHCLQNYLLKYGFLIKDSNNKLYLAIIELLEKTEISGALQEQLKNDPNFNPPYLNDPLLNKARRVTEELEYELYFGEGLRKKDAIILKKIDDELNENCNSWPDEYYQTNNFEEILKTISSESFGLFVDLKGRGIFHKISSEDIEYVRGNVSLIPFVFANNKCNVKRFYSSNSCHFLCQFHPEKTPSMGVSLDKNLFYCFGCGTSGNVFDYLMKSYNINFPNAVYFAASVYNIILPNNPYKNNEEVKRIKETIQSREYLDFVETNRQRNIRRRESTYISDGLIEEIISFNNGNLHLEFKSVPPRKLIKFNPEYYGS